jgi:hypothetical protein
MFCLLIVLTAENKIARRGGFFFFQLTAENAEVRRDVLFINRFNR